MIHRPQLENHTPEDGRNGIDMDPAAFGTGTHFRRRSSASRPSRITSPQDNRHRRRLRNGHPVHRSWPRKARERWDWWDFDPVAVKTAGENSVKNETDDVIELYEGNLLDSVDPELRADILPRISAHDRGRLRLR